MSLDKAIRHGKEHRKPYRRSKAFDRSCRNGGSCSWCRDNRMTADRKTKAKSAAECSATSTPHHEDDET